VKTCGRCHAGANLSFVQYQPHANARDRKLNPHLYFVRLFMNLLLISVLTFFVIHTILWLVRARYNQLGAERGAGDPQRRRAVGDSLHLLDSFCEYAPQVRQLSDGHGGLHRRGE
jgi:hypothetical protein